MTKTEAKDTLKHGPLLAVFDALEFLRKHTIADDFEDFASAYLCYRDFIVRILLVELVSQIASEQARAFLTQVARNRTHFLVRYYAMRILIDHGYETWRPSGKIPSSDYYASLSAYESYVSGLMTLDELHELAAERNKWNGDHWYWLTEIEEGYIDSLPRSRSDLRGKSGLTP